MVTANSPPVVGGTPGDHEAVKRTFFMEHRGVKHIMPKDHPVVVWGKQIQSPRHD